MEKLKKYIVLRDVTYGTFAEHGDNHIITKTDARRYVAGEAIELPANVAEGLLAEGAIGSFDKAPKDETPPEAPKDEKPPDPKDEGKKDGK